MPPKIDPVPTANAKGEALIRRAQEGDAEAMAEIYQLYAPVIFRYFFFRVNDQATAEDLTGEVFLDLVKALPRYVERGIPFTAWLFRIAHARLVDHHRRARHRQTEELSESLTDHASDPEAEAVDRAQTRRLDEAMMALTDEQRLVIQLRFVEGFSLEETAQTMRKSIGAVKALQHRALRELARVLET
jgi:RNA polymerase sigma-70 factor (ECF subfamily)